MSSVRGFQIPEDDLMNGHFTFGSRKRTHPLNTEGDLETQGPVFLEHYLNIFAASIFTILVFFKPPLVSPSALQKCVTESPERLFNATPVLDESKCRL